MEAIKVACEHDAAAVMSGRMLMYRYLHQPTATR